MDMLKINLFAPAAVSLGDAPVLEQSWPGNLPRTILQFLASRPGMTAATEELLETFWAHLPGKSARQNLYVALNRLRQVLAAHGAPGTAGADLVLSTPAGYRLAESTWVDYQVVRQAAGEMGRLRQQPPEKVLAYLDSLHRPRPESLLVEHPYADWAIAAREQAMQDYIALKLLHADMLARTGDRPGALEGYASVFELDPLQEAVARQAMEAAVQAGDPSRALRIFDRLRRALSEELGVDPVPETLALHSSILRGASSRPAPPGRPAHQIASPLTSVVYLGLHGRDEDLEALWQAIVAEVVEPHHGWRERTDGRGLVAGFSSMTDALHSALAVQQAAEARSRQLKTAIHIGSAAAGDGGAAARALCTDLAAIASEGQVLLSLPAGERAAEVLPAGAEIRPLGLHRLLNLYGSESVNLLVHPSLSASAAPASLTVLPNNLPTQLTTFVGRRTELVELTRLLASHRLITLTGPGGIGKTRLALQTAGQQVPLHPDGAWLAELAAVESPAMLPQAVAEALGLETEPGSISVESLATRLQQRQMLLILDNCEHLAEACSRLATALLRACPGVRVLATSRHRLGSPGEILWAVPPLLLPQPGEQTAAEIQQAEAARLFLDRAQARIPGFRLTDEDARALMRVCYRLDGIPLALELAAARIRLLSLQEMATRLDDRFRILTGGDSPAPRHQTLRAAIDWSHDLLSPGERGVWRRLSVFVGGATLAAVEAVCPGDSVMALELLDLLTSLVDKSIVTTDQVDGETRFRLLETIRQYGLERLNESGEAESQRTRHRDWYLAWAEQTNAAVASGENLATWLRRLEREHDNLLAALHWCRQRGDATEGLRLAVALARFWDVRGKWAEGLTWLRPALEAREVDPPLRARALNAAGALARHLGEYDLSKRCLQEAIELARSAGDSLGLARALNSLGAAYLELDMAEAAKPLYLESLTYFRHLELRGAQAVVLNNLGNVSTRLSDFQGAVHYYEESRQISEEMGDQANLALAFNNLGYAALCLGDHARAEAHLDQSLLTYRRLGDESGQALALSNRGLLELHRGETAKAEVFLCETLTLRRKVLNHRGVANALELLSSVAAQAKRWRRAAVLMGASEALTRSLGGTANTDVAPERDARNAALAADLAAALEPAELLALREQGRNMDPEQVATLALSGGDPADLGAI